MTLKFKEKSKKKDRKFDQLIDFGRHLDLSLGQLLQTYKMRTYKKVYLKIYQ